VLPVDEVRVLVFFAAELLEVFFSAACLPCPVELRRLVAAPRSTRTLDSSLPLLPSETLTRDRVRVRSVVAGGAVEVAELA
jgi:hypothetical protein